MKPTRVRMYSAVRDVLLGCGFGSTPSADLASRRPLSGSVLKDNVRPLTGGCRHRPHDVSGTPYARTVSRTGSSAFVVRGSSDVPEAEFVRVDDDPDPRDLAVHHIKRVRPDDSVLHHDEHSGLAVDALLDQLS
jgi:hypothetical protein